MTCDRRLYLNRDKSRVVEEGDKDAAWLFASEGDALNPPDAARYSLQWEDGKIILPAARAAQAKAKKKREDEAEAKAKKKREDEAKARKKPEDKAAKKAEDKGTARPPDVKA